MSNELKVFTKSIADALREKKVERRVRSRVEKIGRQVVSLARG